MPSDLAGRIRANADFIALERARGGFSRALCAAILVIYFGFILLVAFGPNITAMPIGGGITLAFPLGLAVIAAAIAITGIYVLRANGEYDRLTAKILRETR